MATPASDKSAPAQLLEGEPDRFHLSTRTTSGAIQLYQLIAPARSMTSSCFLSDTRC
jgi:hypothetical protein